MLHIQICLCDSGKVVELVRLDSMQDLESWELEQAAEH